MDLNRTIAPPIKPIENLTLPFPEKIFLTNQIPVYIIRAGDQDVVKIEFIFNAGRKHETVKAVSAATARLIKEGTKSRTSFEISSAFDFFGAALQVNSYSDNSNVVLFSLNKHLHNLFPLLKEILTEAIFPQKEIDTFIQNSIQKILVSREKVEYLAQKKFMEVLYGENHYLGYTPEEDDYNKLTREMLHKFYSTQYTSNNCTIIISGKVESSTIEGLQKYFGGNDWLTKTINLNRVTSIPSSFDENYFVEKKDAVQSALRIGKHMINRGHPDWSALRFTNTILGGYFGSRLMSNLREDKGFCYGIYSSLISIYDHGHMSIGSEVGSDVTKQAVDEIFFEINRLRNEEVGNEEMDLVRNYMMGVMLADLDGPFNLSEVIRGYVVNGIEFEKFSQNIETIKKISSSRVQEIANMYFNPETMVTVVSGSEKI